MTLLFKRLGYTLYTRAHQLEHWSPDAKSAKYFIEPNQVLTLGQAICV